MLEVLILLIYFFHLLFHFFVQSLCLQLYHSIEFIGRPSVTQSVMTFINILKTGVCKLDFFRTNQFFRYKSEAQYKSSFGGIVSLLLIVGLIARFKIELVDTFDKVLISSESSTINSIDPTPFNISTFPEDKFMLGVEIWGHDLNTGNRFFDVILRNPQFGQGDEIVQNQTNLNKLEPCTYQHWDGFPSVQKDFSRLQMNRWLCLPRNMKYNIQGKYTSVLSQTLQISVNKCTNESNPERPCAPQTQIDEYIVQNTPLWLTAYFINPLINPTNQEYLSYYLEDNNQIAFNDKFGSDGILFLEEFTIRTDDSIWPFTDYNYDKGAIVTQFAYKNSYIRNGDQYCSFSFFKSGDTHAIDRGYQKFDQVLSYMGGLFGTLTICLFIVKVYNQASFEIRLGASLFLLKDQSQEKILRNFNFFRFLITGFYKLLTSIGFSPDWKQCKEYHHSNQQMSKQLDVLYLLKRIIFLQKAITALLDEHQLKGIHLHQKLTLKEAKNNRRNFKAKKKLIQLNKKKREQFTIKNLKDSLSIQEYISEDGSVNEQNICSLNGKSLQKQLQSGPYHFKRQTRKHIKTVFMRPFFEDSSSSSQSQHSGSEQILNELSQLKKQAKCGDSVSTKIWLKFNENIRNDITRVLDQDNVSIENEKQGERSMAESGVQLYKYLPPIQQPGKIKVNRLKSTDEQRIQKHLQISNRIQRKRQANLKFSSLFNEIDICESKDPDSHPKMYNKE